MSNNNFVFVNASPPTYIQQGTTTAAQPNSSNNNKNNNTTPNVAIPQSPSTPTSASSLGMHNNGNMFNMINPAVQQQLQFLNSMLSGNANANANMNMQALLNQYAMLQQQQQQQQLFGLQKSLPNNNTNNIMTSNAAVAANTTIKQEQVTPQTIQLPNYSNNVNNSMMTQQNNLSSSNQQPLLQQPPMQIQQPPMTVTNTSSSATVTETAETPKKRKTPSKPSSSTKKPKVDLTKKLKSLEKEELIQLITTLPEKFPSKYDTLQQDILTICPDADVDGAIQDLEQLRRNVEKAFPRAKYGTNRDDYAFKRVKPTLTSFKKSVTEKTTEVKNGQNWGVMCRYLNKLMEVVDDLPVFDSAKNNSIRDALFKHCATNYTAMLKARDCNLTSEEIESIESTLDQYDKKKDEVFTTAVEKLNTRKSK